MYAGVRTLASIDEHFEGAFQTDEFALGSLPQTVGDRTVSKVMLVVVVLLLSGLTSQSQSVQDYDAHLARLQKSIPEWQAQIEAVDPAKINVSYQTGKLLESVKNLLLKDLLTISISTAAIREQRQLSLEINLYSALAVLH